MPNLIAENRLGQRVALSHSWHGPVKRGVEDRYLPKPGMRLGDRANTLELEWLMQRHDHFEFLKLLEHRFVHQNGLVVSSTLDDTVAHADNFEIFLMALEPGDDKPE